MEDKNVSFKIKGKKRTKEVVMRNYSSEAAEMVAKLITREYDKEKALGFDPKDRQSMIDYKFEYTPIGDNILVKQFSISEVLVSETNVSTGKYIVVVVGPEVSRPIRPGDIVNLGGAHMPNVAMGRMTLNGIKLIECSCFAIGGIYIPIDEYHERINDFKQLRIEDERNGE